MLNRATEKNSTKVLILCQLFYPELISTGQTLTELCEKLVDMNIDVDVLCGPPTITERKVSIQKERIYHGINIKRVWGTRFNKLNLVGRITNQITFSISVFLHLIFDKSRKPILVLTNPRS